MLFPPGAPSSSIHDRADLQPVTTSLPPEISPADLAAPKPRRLGQFHLLRFFAITSGIAIVVVALIPSWTHYLEEVDDVVELIETRNATLARAFANSVRPEYDSLLFQDTARTVTPLVDPRAHKLHAALQQLSRGIANGYATIGTIGFEGRWDYTVVGPVVNLASRLCPEAKSGEIIVDRKAFRRIHDTVEAESAGDLVLKGFSQPVPAFMIGQVRAT